MNKKELIKRIEADAWVKEAYPGDTEVYISLSKLRELLDQLDEPKSTPKLVPMVPDYVAKWFENYKDDLSYAIYSELTNREKKVSIKGTTPFTDPFTMWLESGNNIEILCQMKQGYQVDLCPLYVVRMPKTEEYLHTVDNGKTFDFIKLEELEPLKGRIVFELDEIPEVYKDFAEAMNYVTEDEQ